eukprot:789709-Pyramimonas_sp.AAC.1
MAAPACVPQPTSAHPAHVSEFPSALPRATSLSRRTADDEKRRAALDWLALATISLHSPAQDGGMEAEAYTILIAPHILGNVDSTIWLTPHTLNHMYCTLSVAPVNVATNTAPVC